MKSDTILIKPKITEKALQDTKFQIYTFEVAKSATKFRINDSVEKLFNVKVDSIKTMIKKGKLRRVGRRMKTKVLPDRKIAFIHLKSGKIDLFPQP